MAGKKTVKHLGVLMPRAHKKDPSFAVTIVFLSADRAVKLRERLLVRKWEHNDMKVKTIFHLKKKNH